MTDQEFKELGLPTDAEIEERDRYYNALEDVGISDTKKYFDRMHDKVFSINNILIAAYFALIAFRDDVPNWILVIPAINSLILLNIDYRMLRRSRLQANYTNLKEKERETYGRIQTETNLYSLLSIWSTVFVLLLFGYFLI